MKFSKLVVPSRAPSNERQLTEEEWAEARRQTVQAMIEEYGEIKTRRFMERFDRENPTVTVRPPSTTVDAAPTDYTVD